MASASGTGGKASPFLSAAHAAVVANSAKAIAGPPITNRFETSPFVRLAHRYAPDSGIDKVDARIGRVFLSAPSPHPPHSHGVRP